MEEKTAKPQEKAEETVEVLKDHPSVPRLHEVPKKAEEMGLREEVTQWWMDLAREELNMVLPKAVEYGGEGQSDNLVEIGRTMESLGLHIPEFKNEKAREEYLVELGIYFYIVGKVGRWTAALKRGEYVSDDTIKDLGVYARMVQRVRDVGGWLK